ncbi:MAG: type IX secretion system membrane protein PorP/SprF [Bacteroidetes bacterium]|nr:MAG: type IX secretion system membrane protein PorP/SprF [Bacteroidota bacterium]
MKRLITILFISFIIHNSGLSQQLPQYSQWSFHQFALNPAHAGIKNCLDVHALYRMQWMGFPGAPKSGFFTMSTALASKRKQYLSARHGFGLRFITDRIGDFSTTKINLAYAGHFNFNRDNRLSLGIYGGVVQFGFDPTNATTLNPDPEIMKEASFIAPDASFGAWWNSENYYVGLILDQLIPYGWPDPGNDSRFRFHPSMNGGTRIKVNEKVSILPAFLLKFPPRGPFALDLQAMVDFKNVFITGVAYRNQDAIILHAGLKLKERFTLNYSFDITTSYLRKGGSNTHELSLSFTTCRPENKSTYSCPLF